MSAEPETYEEKEFTEPDEVNVGLVATVTVVGAILVLSIALALNALVRDEAAAVSVDVNSAADLGTVARLKSEQRSKLEGAPSWADKAKGFVSQPIERAEELTLADIQKDPKLATKSAVVEEEEPDGGADGGAAAEATGAAGDTEKVDPAAPSQASEEPAKAADEPAPPKKGEKKNVQKPVEPKGATPAPAAAPAAAPQAAPGAEK
jgi:hypothetical protein